LKKEAGMGSVGSTLSNRYRLEKKIGAGGFATVFLATDLDLGRRVAVKLLEQEWARNKEVLTRFRSEARLSATLDHSHILQIYDFGVVRGMPYLIMPYVSGGTLAERMKREQLTLDEIGFYLDQVGSALDYAHQQGVIHRDVKPGNLLIRHDGQLVLMDFGLAKLLDNVSLETQTVILGTVAYMAPEQCQGFVSAASDRYMLGVVLYQMLAGKLPYEGNTTQVLLRHVHSAPDSLVNQPTMRSVPPNVVQALDEMIARALAKQPNDRYPSCQALSYAYQQALARIPRRTPRLQSGDKFAAQHILDGTVISDENPLASFPPAIQAASPDATILEPGPAQQKKVLLRPARLLVTTEPQKVFSAAFDLVGDTLTLGRAQDNHIYIPLAIISRHHAELSLLNSETKEVTYKIVERKTINPLYFNGKKIAEKVLEDGDTLVIGERGYTEYIVKLTYQAPEYGFM